MVLHRSWIKINDQRCALLMLALILCVGYQAQIFVPLFPFFPGTLLARPRFQLNQPMLLNVIQDQE